MKATNVKVYAVNECDWVAATSAEEARDWYLKETDLSDSDVYDEAKELDTAAMERIKHYGEDGCQYNPPISFREELANCIAQGQKFPCLFASTEY